MYGVDSEHEDPGWIESKRPFPFIHTCLNVGLYYAFDQALSPSALRLCNWDERIDSSGTPAGNTVLDLTELSAVRYSFVYIEYRWLKYQGERRKREGSEDGDIIPRNKPLSATQYLEIACAEWDNQDEDDGTELAEHLKDVEIIDVATLKSAWPVTWRRTEDEPQETQPNQDTTPSSLAPLGSLRETSLEKVIIEAFSCSLATLPKVLESVEHLPDFWSALKKKVIITPLLVSGSVTAGHLFRTIFIDEQIVDLSLFNLSEVQISEILCQENVNNSVRILSLSGNENIQAELLRKVLQNNKSLKELHLLDTPQIPLQIKLEIMRSIEGTQLIDSELLAAPFLFSTKWGEILYRPPPYPLQYVSPAVKQIALLICGDGSTELQRLPGGDVDISMLVQVPAPRFTSSNLRYTTTLPLDSVNRDKLDTLASLAYFTTLVMYSGGKCLLSFVWYGSLPREWSSGMSLLNYNMANVGVL